MILAAYAGQTFIEIVSSIACVTRRQHGSRHGRDSTKAKRWMPVGALDEECSDLVLWVSGSCRMYEIYKSSSGQIEYQRPNIFP